MRCPACGYTNQKQQAAVEVKIIFKDIPESLKEKLIMIGKKLKPFIDKQTMSRQWNQFMYAIDIVDYSIVERTVNQYLLSEYHKEGKGFAYLKAMVHLNVKNHEKHKAYELAKHGANPPLITNEEEE